MARTPTPSGDMFDTPIGEVDGEDAVIDQLDEPDDAAAPGGAPPAEPPAAESGEPKMDLDIPEGDPRGDFLI